MTELLSPTRGPLASAPTPEHVIRLVFSRIIGESRGNRGSVRHIALMLTALTGDEVPVIPAGDRSLREIGFTGKELTAVWRAVKNGTGLLPDNILDAFFGDGAQAGAAIALTSGPGETWEKTDSILEAWVGGVTTTGEMREARGRRAVDGHPISSAYVKNLEGAMRRFHRTLVEIRRLGTKLGVGQLVSEWSLESLPPYRQPASYGAIPAATDRSAPPLIVVRRALKRLDLQFKRRSASVRGRPSAVLFARDRATLGIFAVLGGRIGSLVGMVVGDYLPRHVFPDGTVGPAIRITLGEQSKGDGATRIKGIPRQLAVWIEEWFDISGIRDEPSCPFWVSIKQPGREARSPLSQAAMEVSIERVLRPFIPTDRRYSPHTLRHLAAQLAELAGSDWITENREELMVSLKTKGLPLSAVSFADILLDHSLSSVTDAYRDLDNEPARETWSRITALRIWELVWGDRGARRGPDRVRRTAARYAEAAARSKVASIKLRIEELKQHKLTARAHAIHDAESLSTQDLLRRMLEIDNLADAVVDSSELLRLADLELAAAIVEVQAAAAARVPVDDELGDDSIWADASSQDSLEEVLETPRPQRDWVSVREFLWCFGEGVMPPATFYRWLKGKLPHPQPDRRNLFELRADGTVVGLQELSPRNRRLHVPELDLTRYPVAFRERLDCLLEHAVETDRGKGS